MGIPKCFRWLSERYPGLSEKVHEWELPEFDNLYLDMNGYAVVTGAEEADRLCSPSLKLTLDPFPPPDPSSVIHNCSHPNDDDVHFRITDEQIYKDIFNYIDFLFKTIKPRKVMFMAVDGVAPRAKMNQQRSRRFRTAKEALDKEQEAIRKGKEKGQP